jgi:hypothetical protein
MSENSGPGKYSRPDSIAAAYASQIAAQNNAREQDKLKKAAAAEQAKKQQQLSAAVRTEETFLAQKIAAEKLLAPNKQTLLTLKANAIAPGSPGGTTITGAEQTTINQYYALQVAPLETQVAQLTANYEKAVATRKNIQKSIIQGATTAAQKEVIVNKARRTTTKPKVTSAGSDVIQNAGYSPVVYKYNAPMTKTAYLNPFGPQQQTSSRSVTDPGSYSDAKIAWSEEAKASRGTIQMSLSYATNQSSANSTSKSTYDDTLYGFKFLYNPKEVAMSWGIAEGVNPDVIQSGLDKSTPIGLGLMSSTVSFSILLNRTNDMAYLDSNGLIGLGNPNPYPSVVSQDDLKMIYKKGTMYDMEYFFRTINGLNSTYDSNLNGKTADQGWLNGTPVELHLGDGMRYLVRVGSLDINHAIFNERMVPILSTVNITCHRFYDKPDVTDTSRTTSGG